jgi:hypothetical protein
MAPAARNSSQGSTRAAPIRSLLRLVNAEEQEEGRVFGREEIAAITAAFKQLLLDFKLVDRDDAVVTMLAKLVIELARNGERDPERLRAAVLKGLTAVCERLSPAQFQRGSASPQRRYEIAPAHEPPETEYRKKCRNGCELTVRPSGCGAGRTGRRA